MERPDYYEILEVPVGASCGEIARAYRRLARRYHPDLQPSEGKEWAEEQMKRLNEAYAVLGDRAARARYNAARGPRFGGASSRETVGPTGRRKFTARAKSAFWVSIAGFLVAGAYFYLFVKWESVLPDSLTPLEILGLRGFFAFVWFAVLGLVLVRMAPRRRW